MRRTLAIILILAGCTAASSDRSDLDSLLAGRVAGPPQDCVDAAPAANLRPVDARTLAVESGPTLYVNRLPDACPGLGPTATLIVELNENRYCRGDHFRTRPFGGSAVPGPICVLGDFTPYRRPR